jgi:SAM-dependent methyltransferase
MTTAQKRPVTVRLRDSGERLVPEWVKPTDRLAVMLLEQHLHRYRIAAEAARGKHVLDLGCGVGYGAQLLAEAGAAKVTATDRDPAALDYAARHYSHPAIEYVLGDATTHRSGEYDLVTCFEVLEHVRSPTDLLTTIGLALKPAGMLYISGSVYPTMDIYGFHLRDYDKVSFRAELRQAGFTVVDELEQSSEMSAADVRRAARLHWRAFPIARFRRHPLRVIRRLVRTHFVHGVLHEEMMLVCSRDSGTEENG